MTERTYTETVKIPAEETGLKAALYLHLSFGEDGRPCGVALSSPGKFEGGALDRAFRFMNLRLAEAFEGQEARSAATGTETEPVILPEPDAITTEEEGDAP